MKVCVRCNKEKELTEFSKDKTRPDGLFPYCCEGNFIKEWNSITEASNNLSTSNIQRTIKYNRTAGGFKWKYL